MKKIFEKFGMLRSIGALMSIISIILFIVAAFIGAATPDMILKMIGILLFIVGGMIVALTSDDHRLFKSLLVFIVSAFLFTWLFPYGYFQGADYYEYGMQRLGLVDIGYTIYYAINFTMDKIIFLLVVTGFYGVLSRVSGYQKLVENLAKKCSKQPMITTMVVSVVLFVLTSLLSQSFVVLLFIPFFISVLLKMNLDKLTVFAITFGSALVGLLGCTYGTDSLASFNYYLTQDIKVGLTYRFIIAGVALVLYNFFLVMRVRKITKETKKNTKNNELEDDPFKVEATKSKVSSIPVIIILALLAIITILGYVKWSDNFGINVFNKFHEWLTGLKVGSDFTIISYLLGSEAQALGTFQYVFSISSLVLLSSVIIAFLYKVKFNEYIDAFFNGTKKMLKPVLFIIGAYMIFGVCYLSPVVPAIVNWLSNLVKGFNPFLTSLIAFITSAFQSDFGYTAYTVGGLLTTTYAGNLAVAHNIFTSMYGLVQLFLPTSALLVVGLSMMKVDYKDWLKYIWIFVVGMIVMLLILFSVVTYM